MDKDALNAAIDAFADSAYGSSATPELGTQRAESIDRYLGTNLNPAPPGRSQIRDRTTYETIEWIKPSLLRIFCGSDQVVEFDPVGPEDEKQAVQESQYTNYVVTQRNNWHQLCNDWFGDALLQKNGYIHAYWQKKEITETEKYVDLTDDSFALLVEDDELQVVKHSARVNEEAKERQDEAFAQQMQQYQMIAVQAQMQGQMPPPAPQQPPDPMLHDVEVRRVNAKGQVKLCVLPPERCLIDIDTPDWTLDECNYFEYWDYQTIGQLRAAGLKVPDDIADTDASDGHKDDRRDTIEERARDLYDESTQTASFSDPSMRRVRVRYIWIRFDGDDDGINELNYAIRIGSEILFTETCEEIPVASITPIPLAHRHIGMSVADSVEDIEDVNTNITRGAIDNLNLSNTPRLAVSDRVNMSDLLDVRVGGVIRVDGQPPQEIMPVEIPNVFGAAVNAIQFFDSRRMNRTGINAYFQGTDSNTLNKTASGINQLTSSAAQRVEMIARLFAIGVRRLFMIVHRLILQHGHSEDVMRIRNQWVTVDPAQWRKRYDLRIVVGLGTGSKEGQIQQLGQLFMAQMQTLPLGVSNPQNIYHTLIEMAKASGFSGSEQFFTDPTAQPPPQPPPPPEIIVEQMKGQITLQTKQADMQQNQQTQELRVQFDKWKAEQELALEKYKAELEAQTKIAIEQIRLSGTKDIELTKIDSTEKIKAAELTTEAQMNEHERMDKMMEAEKSSAESNALMSQVDALKQAIVAFAQNAEGKKPVGIEKVRDKTGRMVASRIKRADGSVDEISIQ